MLELLGVLAIFKVTVMLIDFDGPLDIVKKLRDFIIRSNTKLLNMECFFCLSTVVALPVAFLLADGSNIVLYCFGLSGGAFLVNQISERL